MSDHIRPHVLNGRNAGDRSTIATNATLVDEDDFDFSTHEPHQKGLGSFRSTTSTSKPATPPVWTPQPAAPKPAPTQETLAQAFPELVPSVPLDKTCWPPIYPGRPRTLVLCFDGTGDHFDDDNSNIVGLFKLLKKNDPTRQMCYYQAGIGTYSDPAIATSPVSSYIANTLDTAIAWYLHAHVQEGYEFLMQNYAAGDRICLFGFSRGAYTARALAGMLHKVGLIPPWNKQQVPFAWEMYRNETPKGLIDAAEFKATFSINVIIDFVGVFDTVASVGIISKELPFAASNHAIRVFRHALSLDERRVKFKSNHFQNLPPISSDTERGIKSHQFNGTLSQAEAFAGKRTKNNEPQLKHRPETDSLEVWFAGCHCDVGGGSVSNSVTTNLAMIPFRWMIKECVKAGTGVLFDLALLDRIGLTVQHLPLPPSIPYPADLPPLAAPPSDEGLYVEEEEHDLVSPKFDQLALAWAWWILEIIPMRTKALNEKKEMVKGYFWPNFGNGRGIPDPNKFPLHIHKSVKQRMQKLGYIPEAFWVDDKGKRQRMDHRNPETLPPITWKD